MTTEQKARAYDEAIEKIKKGLQPLRDGSKISGVTKDFLEEVFPELNESEDDRIRKVLVDFFKSYKEQNTCGAETFNGIPIDNILAWFEKQGEKEINNFEVIPGLYKCVHRMFDGTPDGKLLFEIGNVYKCLSKHDRAEFEVSYGHSVYLEDPVVCKHFIPFEKSDDKIEPKFKVGDWIIRSTEGFKHNTYLVTEVKDYYVCEDLKGRRGTFTFNDVHKNFKLWDISDAKDGDVLINDFHLIFIFKEIKNNISISHCSIIDRGNDVIVNSMAERKIGDVNLVKCHPATKEQRDILMKAITDAGCEWDAERKELKRVDWSEEDAVRLQRIIGFLWYNRKGDTDAIYQQEQDINWLKSLKQRL